ncbi:threonine synthase [Mariprofundus ferrooxydans]|uniref:threonine synthase n=1 Tax=Mariprofundus ferrooxydans TaxID=314344 RepID=UPI0006BF1039|nr:threonine synthase [Mariprofundus ferrooxydans]KON48191.1 threonine synthase [Mariprofundus ferrooxydans]
MSIDLLIITDALLQHQDGLQCHPDVLLWQQQLAGRRCSWYECAAKNPLGWYSALTECAPAALLAAASSSIPVGTRQVWVASPYHAQLMRDAVHVLPEGQLAWTADDAVRLCAVLNPLLAEEQMQLLNVGAALLLTCKKALDAYPHSFAAIAGHMLPDRHHDGEDGGRLDRLLSELQMLLFQHPSMERHERQESDINGIWLWGSAEWPQLDELASRHIPVATRNPFLQAIADGRSARMIISDSARLDELLQTGSALPEMVILAGDGYAAVMKKSWLPGWGKPDWQPKSVKAEPALLSMLQSQL